MRLLFLLFVKSRRCAYPFTTCAYFVNRCEQSDTLSLSGDCHVRNQAASHLKAGRTVCGRSVRSRRIHRDEFVVPFHSLLQRCECSNPCMRAGLQILEPICSPWPFLIREAGFQSLHNTRLRTFLLTKKLVQSCWIGSRECHHTPSRTLSFGTQHLLHHGSNHTVLSAETKRTPKSHQTPTPLPHNSGPTKRPKLFPTPQESSSLPSTGPRRTPHPTNPNHKKRKREAMCHVTFARPCCGCAPYPCSPYYVLCAAARAWRPFPRACPEGTRGVLYAETGRWCGICEELELEAEGRRGGGGRRKGGGGKGRLCVR